MAPIDPAETTKKQNESQMAPPYVDDDLNMELTERGMRVAENEKRDAVTGRDEAGAAESPESEAALDDIAYPEGDAEAVSPEQSAMREARPPESQ